jgi:predicted transcriptional regulator
MESNHALMPERDEDTGRYTAEYSIESFKEAIRELGRDASTKAIADEVGCEYDAAYKKLTRMEDRGLVTGRKIGSARLWEVKDDE